MNGDIPIDVVIRSWMDGWGHGLEHTYDFWNDVVDGFFNEFLGLQKVFRKYKKLWPNKKDGPLLTIPKTFLENRVGAVVPFSLIMKTLLLDVTKLVPYEVVLDKKTFHQLLLFKVPQALKPKITRRKNKIVLSLLWVKATNEKTLVIPENLLAMAVGMAKAQGVISGNATFSN